MRARDRKAGILAVAVLLAVIASVIVDADLGSAAPGDVQLVTSRANGTYTNGSKTLRDQSPDGEWIVLTTDSSDMLGGSAFPQAVRMRRGSAAVELVSVSVSGGFADRAVTDISSISSNGQLVAFQTRATNLVSPYPFPLPTESVYLRDLGAGTTTMLRGEFPPGGRLRGSSLCRCYR